MMSRKAKYALIAIQHLARYYERGPRLIGEIAEAEKLPKKFLELILLEMKNAGMLESKKGKGGGYVLAKAPDDISVAEVVRTIDGPLAPMRCASVTAPLPCEECLDPATCGIRSAMKEARDAIAEVLERVTIGEVCRREDAMKKTQDRPEMYFI
jgi:Rrf2 family protein